MARTGSKNKAEPQRAPSPADRPAKERQRIEQTSGFQPDRQQVPVDGKQAQEAGGTEAATPRETAVPPQEQKH